MIEYYGEAPSEPLRLKIVNHGGKLYVKVDNDTAQILDTSSEVKLREGVYEPQQRARETEQTVDMSALPPIDCGRTGRLFGLKSSIISGYSTNFKRNARAAKILRRCMILFAYVIFCNSITKVLNKNIDYAQKMEGIAERDGLTDLYNKSKYLQMKESDYQKWDKVGIIYFDINYLKRVNDELGHEWGDVLICTVAKGLKEISGSQNCVYRVGGDEFVMVLPDADNNTVEKKVEEWNLTIAKMQSETHLDISVSYGYACGNGKDFEKIASEADRGMYEYKRKIHSADA